MADNGKQGPTRDAQRDAQWQQMFGAIVSMFNPEIGRAAEAVAKSVLASLPEDSFLRRIPVERLVGALTGFAENAKKRRGPVGRVLMEKGVDFAEFFGRAFSGRGDQTTAKVSHDWINRFYDEAAKRVQKSADPESELEQIKLEFELRYDLLRTIEELRKQAEPKKEVTPIDWQEMQDRFEKFLVGLAKRGGDVVRESKKTARKVDHLAANTAAPAVRRLGQWLESKGVRR